MSARVVVVAATGTDVGKTHVTCALLAAARARGLRVVATKPVATGVTDGERAEDAALHAEAGGLPYRAPLFTYARPVSPHLAAREEGRPVSVVAIVDEARGVARGADLVLVESAGGVYSPLGPSETNADLVRALGGPWVLVAPDRIGVLHDVGATVRAVRADGLPAPLLALSTPATPDASTGSNGAEVGAVGLGRVVAVFPRAAASAEASRQAADALLDAILAV